MKDVKSGEKKKKRKKSFTDWRNIVTASSVAQIIFKVSFRLFLCVCVCVTVAFIMEDSCLKSRSPLLKVCAENTSKP